MKTSKQQFRFSQTVLAVALMAAFSPSYADEDVAQFTKPDSTVSVGIGAVSGNTADRAIFGQYSGMRSDSGYGLFDIDMIKRDDATGMWMTLEGRNLGLENRELRFSQQKQGDWRYSLEYGELLRSDIRTVNTAMQGAGSTTPTVVRLATPGTGSSLNLETKRKSFTVSGDKWLSPTMQLELSFKNEDKDGARIFGKGFACTSGAAPLPTSTSQVGCAASPTQWALLMLPEPINSTTRQLEAKLNFTGDNFLVTGGYYGSYYTNSSNTLTPTVPAALNNPLGAATTLATPAGVGMTSYNGLRGILQLPMALPPDNQAHQFYINGNYAFTAKTRLTFKYAYTHATQDEDFSSAGLTGAPAGRSNLGGVMNTNLFQLGLTSRPLPKLSLLANVRYEKKEDKTPIALYNVEGVNRWTNGQMGNKKLAGKLEASYQLPENFRGTIGLDYESIDRGTFTSSDQVAGLTALRQKTDENGYRLELRRAMAENFSGTIGYVSSKRDGSTWLKPNSGVSTGVTPVDISAFASTAAATLGRYLTAFPITMSDRQRDKVKVSADWAPTDDLSLQLVAENGTDRYPGLSEKGARGSDMDLISIDATWRISEDWRATGYWSYGNQTQKIAHSTGYIMGLKNRNDTLGLGIKGKATSKLEVGADLSVYNDRNRYDQSMDKAASAANIAFLAASGGLPDVTYRQHRVNLFGKYAIEKNADIRVDLIHQRARFNEWTWGYNGIPFAYSDNTTISQKADQNVTFLGASYIYKWQ